MKIIFVFLLVPLSLICNGQKSKADKLYEKGITAFNNKDYITADSLFKQSADLQPDGDVYFNLAVVKNKLGDTCSSCEYLKIASTYGDYKAYELFQKGCFRKDSIQYSNPAYFCLISTRICTQTSMFNFYQKSPDGKAKTVFLIKDNGLSEADYFSPDFEIQKYIDTTILTICDIMPTFPGGESELMFFLRDNIKYPQLAREGNVQGCVYVQFVINADGVISNVTVLKGIGGGCDEEAIRVVKLMPPWIPGKQNGKPVNILFTLPIRYILQG